MTLLVNAWSQIDYTYCSKFIFDTNAKFQKTGFAFPFTIDKKTGKLKTVNHNMSYSGQKKGEHIYSSSGWAGSIKIIAKESGPNKISKIEIDRTTKVEGAPPRIVTIIDFEVKNGKCIPKIGQNTINIRGDNVTTTLFDSNLCRELEKYFNSNKDIKKCFDPKSKENTTIESLLKKNGYDTTEITQKMSQYTPILSRFSYSVEQKILTGTTKTFDISSDNNNKENAKKLGMLGGSPLISGYMILNDCYDKDLKLLISDDSVWSDPIKPILKHNQGAHVLEY